MSLNLYYSFREGIVGLRRARMATMITISTIVVTMVLLGIFLILTVNVQSITKQFRDRVSLEMFIDNSLSPEKIRELRKSLSDLDGIEEVVFISQQEARERFRQDLGEEFLNLLGETPLPPSFQIKLSPGHRSPENIAEVVSRIEELEGVDEVVYQEKLFRFVDRYSRIVFLLDGVIFLTVLLSAVLLVSNTLRLTILSQSRNIQIMELVGATKRLIRRPYLIQGILQGGIGGGIGSIVVWIFVKAVTIRFPSVLKVTPFMILFPFGLSLLLGYLGGTIGIKRFLRAS